MKKYRNWLLSNKEYDNVEELLRDLYEFADSIIEKYSEADLNEYELQNLDIFIKEIARNIEYYENLLENKRE